MELNMTITFTEKELEYIVKEPFNWHASEDAPAEIKKSINKKLNKLKEFEGKRRNGDIFK